MDALDQYLEDLHEQLLVAEGSLTASGVPWGRVAWVFEVVEGDDSVILRARPRLKTDDEMVGRCSDPSCCGP